MNFKKYKNIQLTKEIDNANCITHSGKFHVDDVISTIFLSKLKENIILIRVPTVKNINIENKIVYDIGLGEFDHHQKNRNGQRENGIYYSSIGLLWNKFGKKYLGSLKVKNIDKTFQYIDDELIQYIDATDNMQIEYLENKISPDFIKLCNPEWNENISEDEAFINALKLADEFWNIYIKHSIAEVEAIDIILNKISKSKECYVVFESEIPYRKAIKLYNGNKVKYIILKSRREGYEIRTLTDECKFKEELVKSVNINVAINLTGINELIYVDNHAKLCCTKTLESAIQLVKYNEDK
ncbi:MAG: MYG1 family protein [Clostridia bacterium]